MAKHGVNLWTTYDITPRYQVGFGGQYLSNRVPGNVESGFAGTTSNRAPSFLIFDAMVSYRLTERTDIRLNVFNLTDQTYYDAAYSGFAVPGPGRTAILSTSFRF
jgi:catecholate siderophore receptor